MADLNSKIAQKIQYFQENSGYFLELKKIAGDLALQNVPVVLNCDDFLLRRWFSSFVCWLKFESLEKNHIILCSAVSDGEFASAIDNLSENEVCLLDFADTLSEKNQSYLLEKLEKGFFSERRILLIAGSSLDLNYLSETGKFNKNLCFRLNLLRIRLLSLNERRDEIKVLARFFFDEAKSETGLPYEGFSDSAIDAFENHFWRGGLAELRASVFRAFSVGTLPLINAGNLGLDNTNVQDMSLGVWDSIGEDKSLKNALDSFKRVYVQKILEENGNNQTKAAKVLGLQRTYVSRLMNELNLR